MTTLNVATFNCEWRETRSSDAAIIRERICAAPVDVICLTETQQDFLDDRGYTVTSADFETRSNLGSRRKVLIWSRSPWTNVDTAPAGLPEGRYVAGTTSTPAGQVRVLGVVIPYRFAGVRYGEPKRAPWELHRQYLQALRSALPEQPSRTLILGDFNQRVPRKYQPHEVFENLDEAVLSRFRIATAGVLEPVGRQAIDHICHSSDFSCGAVHSISNAREGGGQISDHFGVRAELFADGRAMDDRQKS
jgi:endonuclease/exonuclease/phosphatase family metal-dependent hydrolase